MHHFLVIVIGTASLAAPLAQADAPLFWNRADLSSVHLMRVAVPIGDISEKTRATLESIIEGWALLNTQIESIPSDQARALAEVVIKDAQGQAGILFLGHCHLIPHVFVSEEAMTAAGLRRRRLIWNALIEIVSHEELSKQCIEAATDRGGKVRPFGFEKFSSDTTQQLDDAHQKLARP